MKQENTQQTRNRMKLPQHNNGHIKKPTANIINNGETIKMFLVGTGASQDAHFYPFYSTWY